MAKKGTRLWDNCFVVSFTQTLLSTSTLLGLNVFSSLKVFFITLATTAMPIAQFSCKDLIILSKQSKGRSFCVYENFIAKFERVSEMGSINEYGPLMRIPTQMKLLAFFQYPVIQTPHLLLVRCVLYHMLSNQILQTIRWHVHNLTTGCGHRGSYGTFRVEN